jgi:serine/threonine-protein kinase RsbT
MESCDLEIRVPVASEGDLVKARQRGRELANEMGFSAGDATLIAAAISELARNIVAYAGRGVIALREAPDGTLVLVAHDEGPGIPDAELALRPGYSTSGGLGLGLPGVRRIADHFEIQSNSNGTTVTVRKKRR